MPVVDQAFRRLVIDTDAMAPEELKRVTDAAEAMRHKLVGVDLDVRGDPWTAQLRHLRTAMAWVDIFHLVWPDEHQKCGIGVAMIKGKDLVREIVETGEAMKVSMAAVPCEELAHAYAIWPDLVAKS